MSEDILPVCAAGFHNWIFDDVVSGWTYTSDGDPMEVEAFLVECADCSTKTLLFRPQHQPEVEEEEEEEEEPAPKKTAKKKSADKPSEGKRKRSEPKPCCGSKGPRCKKSCPTNSEDGSLPPDEKPKKTNWRCIDCEETTEFEGQPYNPYCECGGKMVQI